MVLMRQQPSMSFMRSATFSRVPAGRSSGDSNCSTATDGWLRRPHSPISVPGGFVLAVDQETDRTLCCSCHPETSVPASEKSAVAVTSLSFFQSLAAGSCAKTSTSSRPQVPVALRPGPPNGRSPVLQRLQTQAGNSLQFGLGNHEDVAAGVPAHQQRLVAFLRGMIQAADAAQFDGLQRCPCELLLQDRAFPGRQLLLPLGALRPQSLLDASESRSSISWICRCCSAV